jgi:hypothetical protein
VHSLGVGDATRHAVALMAELEQQESSYAVMPPPSVHWTDADTRGARGQMFGVLECLDSAGETVVLRAFSALLNGQREAPDWVPSLLSAADHENVVLPAETEIKESTWRLQQLEPGTTAYVAERQLRATQSRQLLARINGLCQLPNFRGESGGLSDAWNSTATMPGGVGNCCAPKLLAHGAANALRPVGLLEFFWGVSNPSGSRVHRAFYPCCAEKCQPILGYMLCGAADV